MHCLSPHHAGWMVAQLRDHLSSSLNTDQAQAIPPQSARDASTLTSARPQRERPCLGSPSTWWDLGGSRRAILLLVEPISCRAICARKRGQALVLLRVIAFSQTPSDG